MRFHHSNLDFVQSQMVTACTAQVAVPQQLFRGFRIKLTSSDHLQQVREEEHSHTFEDLQGLLLLLLFSPMLSCKDLGVEELVDKVRPLLVD